MLSFRIFGIPVIVQPWFWVTMVFIGGGLSAKNSQDFFEVLMFVIAGFISILVHELGHALTIRKFGQPTAITLVAFGGFASYPEDAFNRKQSFLVTAAGPALQILLGLFVFLLLNIVPVPEYSLLSHLMRACMIVSIFWAVFNCLPIYPMDGGQMFAAITGPKYVKAVYLIGTFCAVAIGVAAYLFLNSFLIAIFMGLFAYQNWQLFSGSTPTKPY